MRHKRIRIQAVCVAVCAIALNLCLCFPAFAQTQSPPKFDAPSPTYNSFWEKLDRLKEDRQLQQLLEDDLERSIVIRTQIQTEVDRAFGHTTTLINVLLGVLTFIPVLAAVSIWFIRRSVLNQIVAETKKQVQEEVEKELDAEVAAELRKQAEVFQAEIEQLKAEFQEQLSQMKSLFSDAQKEKDQIIQELAQITSATMQETTVTETQKKIQELTQQLERLKRANVSFTANDYVEQGKALNFEGRYEDAIAAYDKAIQMEPNNAKAWFSRGAVLTKLQKFEAAIAAYDRAISQKSDFFLAWFGKARCYAQQAQPELALSSLQQAMQLNSEKCKEALKVDASFDVMRENLEFQNLAK